MRTHAVWRGMVAGVLLAGLVPSEARADEQEFDQAYLILAEVMREIETRGHRQMSRDEIFRGMLRALPGVVPEEHRPLVPGAAGLRADGLLDVLDQAIVDLQATGEDSLQPVALVSRVLNRFLKAELDIHCEFVEPALAEMLASREATLLVGVGISLEEGEDGVLRCFPYPGESADLEGVEPGDLLLAVDGREVGGRSRHEVAGWFAGEDGTMVRMRVKSEGDEARELELRRRMMRPPQIEVTEDAGGSVIRIRRFQHDTARELQRILAGLPEGRRLMIDLRGCVGGDLEAAIASVSLFLPRGAHIADISSREGVARHQSGTENPHRASRLVVRHDGGTASAAELFIAALLGDAGLNLINEGERTYGKGTVQTVIPLEHGGRLTITTEVVTGPGGMDWEGLGIEPRMQAGEPGAEEWED